MNNIIKYMHANIPGEETPPYALIPSYMTTFQSSPVSIWNTVSRLCQKQSKLCLGLFSFGLKLNLPPKTCIPSNAKMTINKNSNSNKEAMDWIEFNKEATKFESDRQYLKQIIVDNGMMLRVWSNLLGDLKNP